jgi:hypothetical protein
MTGRPTLLPSVAVYLDGLAVLGIPWREMANQNLVLGGVTKYGD